VFSVVWKKKGWGKGRKFCHELKKETQRERSNPTRGRRKKKKNMKRRGKGIPKEIKRDAEGVNLEDRMEG